MVKKCRLKSFSCKVICLSVALSVLVLLGGVFSPVYAEGIITTVAGSGATGWGNGGFSGDGEAATVAKLNAPYGVAVDSIGNLYIADWVNNRIRKVNTLGIISTVAGGGVAGIGDGGAATAAILCGPYGVAVDSIGNLYIADTYSYRIRKVDTAGIISTVAGNGVGGFSGDGGAATAAELDLPDSVAVDNIGNLYIADNHNHRIRKVNTAGIISTVAGTGVAGYIGDGGSATVAQLNYPSGVAVDSIGNLYIADKFNFCIRKVDISGIISAVSSGTWLLDGVAVDSIGNLYITDTNNHRIRKVDTAGVISTVAGNNIEGFSGDGGIATVAQLNYPYGVAVDSIGNLYIADCYNQRIRKVTFSPSTRLIALSGNLAFDSVAVGSSATKTLTISNTGNSILTVSSVSYPTGFSGNWNSGTIAANGSQNITVTFAPTEAQSYSGTVTVNSDKTDGTNTIAISGRGTTVEIDCNFVTEIPAVECQSLLDLYSNTNGPNWINKTDWNATNTPCNWYGVSCGGGHVTSISLNFNQLNGAIPNFNLPNLSLLDLSWNQLRGTIPNFNLPNLARLRLSVNELSGTIPNFNLPKLSELDLSNNPLSGDIPNFNLPNLEYLTIAHNQLTGMLPNFNLPNLIWLYIGDNLLSGMIPNFNLPKLTELALFSNQLTGTIPNFNLPNLTKLDLANNRLSGTIPNLNLASLTSVYFYNNCGLTAYDNAQAVVLNSKDPSWQQLNPDCSEVSRIINLSGNLAFDDVAVNTSKQLSFIISNTGNYPLTVSLISYPSGFTGNWSGGVIPDGGSQAITVTFSPTALQAYSGIVTVNSDKTDGANTIAVSGSGTEIPISYTVSGYVKDSANTGVSGVTLNFSNSGGSATTDSSGFYSKSVSKGWSGTVTPEKSGYSFTPQNRSYSNVAANQSEQNYTASPQQQSYVISGYVRDSSNIALSSASLTFSNSGGSVSTNNSGYYTHTIPSGWSGTVTPSKQGYTFEPSNRSYTAVNADQFNQDYRGIPIPFTISGYVTDSANKALSGVRLNFSNYAGSVETDASGYYGNIVYYGWTGTVTPEKSGYTFKPANLSYTAVSSNHTVQNYVGTPTAVPDIAVSPLSLIFTKPKTRSVNNETDDSAFLPASENRDSEVSLPPDGKYATGLLIPEHVKEYWKSHTPSRKYRSIRDMPPSKDWSVYDSPVKNQGQCGSCWAFTTVAMMENLANQANLSVSKDFAEQVLVSCLYGGAGCSGGWYWDALSYIHQNGLPPENCYPYRINNGNCANKCATPDFLVKIENSTPSAGLWGKDNFTVQDIKGALQEGPLCVAMEVADDFYNYSGGIYDYKGGYYEFGHAVLLVGYDDSQQCFRVKNSWGTWWGEGGYFRIAYNDVTDSIKFGCYAVAASGIFIDGQSQTENIVVSNTGTGTLNISSISCDKTWLGISPQSLSAIAPNEQKTLTLSVKDWNSVASPEDTAKITIFSNDPDEASVIVTVKATIPVMAARPLLTVSPPFYGNISESDGKTQLDVSDDSGDTYLDISNGGEGTMSWTAASDKSWLKITQGSSGTDYGRVLIAYDENTGGERTGTITVSASGAVNSPQYVVIRQSNIDVDADNDGMTDSFEFQYGFDSSNPDDASGDRDEDGLTNLEEQEIGTNPNLADTDDDGLSDGYEEDNGLNPLVPDLFTIADVVTVLKILAGMNVSPAGTNADADKNGKVEIRDAVYIFQKLAGLR